MALAKIEEATENPFGGWVGFIPPSSCMPFSPKVISVTRCTSHGATSDVTSRDATVSPIVVLDPKPDDFDDLSPFFLDFFLYLVGRAQSSPDAASGVGG